MNNEQTRFIPPDVTYHDRNLTQPQWYNGYGITAIDGDTVTVLVCVNDLFDLWEKCRIRLFAIDAPEIRAKDLKTKEKALSAKAFLRELIHGKELIVYLPGQKSFERWLGWVFLEDGQNASDLMVAEALAEYREY